MYFHVRFWDASTKKFSQSIMKERIRKSLRKLTGFSWVKAPRNLFRDKYVDISHSVKMPPRHRPRPFLWISRLTSQWCGAFELGNPSREFGSREFFASFSPFDSRKWFVLTWDYSYLLGGGFKHFLFFTPKLGEDSHCDSYFSDWLKPPTSYLC